MTKSPGRKRFLRVTSECLQKAAPATMDYFGRIFSYFKSLISKVYCDEICNAHLSNELPLTTNMFHQVEAPNLNLYKRNLKQLLSRNPS